MAATTTPASSAHPSSAIPFTGWLKPAAKPGCLHPQITTVTTCVGIQQIRKNDTHPENIGKLKSEINPSPIAITNTAAAIPSAGCLIPMTLSPFDPDSYPIMPMLCLGAPKQAPGCL